MRLYLDEDMASRELVRRLALQGHEVLPVLHGVTDHGAWASAQEADACVVTLNAKDFLELAEGTEHHRGLIVGYREGDSTRDMRFAEIAEAIRRIDATFAGDLRDRVVALNHFRSSEPAS